MRAWVHRRAGRPADVLKLEQDFPQPTSKRDEALVRVRAVALNPVGHKTIAVLSRLTRPFPAIPESDVSGVIEQDSADGRWKTGDEVFGIKPAGTVMSKGTGTLAEFVCMPTKQIRRKPTNLAFTEAAALPLAALTAYHSLVTAGGLRSGQRVFINGGSGGVGCALHDMGPRILISAVYAVQIARALGAGLIVSTGSGEEKGAFVRSCGADVVIDYRKDDVGAYLAREYGQTEETKLDLAFDTVGTHAVYVSSSKWLKRANGRYIDVGADLDPSSIGSMLAFAGRSLLKLRPRLLGGSWVPYTAYHLPAGDDSTTKDGGALDWLATAAQKGDLRPELDSTFAFEDALNAYERIMSGRARTTCRADYS